MLSFADLVVLAGYLAGVVLFGCLFVRKSSSTSTFMTAGGALPSWAVGLSIFGTYLSSNTFLGVPGKAYGSNWNAFVFSLSLPLAAWIATRFFVPFYRQSGELSAYQHLERRFGLWARMFAVGCYLLTQLARTGTILFGVSLVMSAFTGWPQIQIILVAGVLITLYTVLGGIEAVIWTDAVQSIILIAGAALILLLLLAGLPEGPGQVFQIGSAEEKFSLGSFAFDFKDSTFWVVLLYGLFINLSNFGIDQSFVQRYHTARDERQAARSVWLGALLYLPISLLFFFIGTSAYSYYQTHPEQLQDLKRQTAELQLTSEGASVTPAALGAKSAGLRDADLGDKVLPHFMVQALPQGARGLLIAAILAAAMSSIDTSLNSSATVILTDVYKRFIDPVAGERESMTVLYLATALIGLAGTGVAVTIALLDVKSVLDAWWLLSGMFAAGVLGLFLLGMLSRRAGNVAAGVGVATGLIAILWILWPQIIEAADDFAWPGFSGLEFPGWLPTPWHENMTIVVGASTILFVGLLVARVSRAKPPLTSSPQGEASSDR